MTGQRPGEAEAAELVFINLSNGSGLPPTEYGVKRAFAAAYPIIATAVAERIAQRIDQVRARHFTQYGNEETGPRNYDWALTHMAVLAREYGKGVSS